MTFSRLFSRKLALIQSVAGIDEGHRRLAHGNEFPFGELEVGDDAVGGRHDRRAQEVELGLFDGSQRLAELRIVAALRPKLLLGALELGLGLAHAGFSRLDLRRRLVGAGFGVDALLDKLEDAADLLARVVALRLCGHQTFLCGADRRRARADGLADACQFRICFLQRDREGLGVDAEQHIAPPSLSDCR